MKTTPNAQKKQSTGSGVPFSSVPPPQNGGDKDQKAAKPGFISFHSVLLSILLLCFFGMVRKVKSYDKFFKEMINESFTKIAEIRELDNYKSIEIRKKMRWGHSYYWLEKMAESLKNEPGAIVLLPPNNYIKTINPGQVLPEPAIAYYYSKVKTAWGNTDYVYKCTHFYEPSKKDGPSVSSIRDRAQLDSLLQVYKGYAYSY